MCYNIVDMIAYGTGKVIARNWILLLHILLNGKHFLKIYLKKHYVKIKFTKTYLQKNGIFSEGISKKFYCNAAH